MDSDPALLSATVNARRRRLNALSRAPTSDPMILTTLLVVQILISIALIALVLMQRSEGGALGMGGGPTGLMTARGAGNLLTKMTWVLGAAFAGCAIALTIFGNMDQRTRLSLDADDIGAAVGVQPAPEGAQPEQPVQPAPPEEESLSLDSLPVGSAPAETPAQ